MLPPTRGGDLLRAHLQQLHDFILYINPRACTDGDDGSLVGRLRKEKNDINSLRKFVVCACLTVWFAQDKQMVDWLVGCSVGWLLGRSVGWLVGWSVDLVSETKVMMVDGAVV